MNVLQCIKAVLARTAIGVMALIAAGSIQAKAVKVEHVEAEILMRDQVAVAGSNTWAALRLRHDPHWHTYWRNPGDSGLPTQLTWQLPAGWKASELQWPAPKPIPIGPMVNYGYEDEVLLPVALSVPAAARGDVTLKVMASWLMCKDVCIPGEAEFEVKLSVGTSLQPGPQASKVDQALAALPKPFDRARVQVFRDKNQLVWLFDKAAPAAGQRLLVLPHQERLVEHAGSQTVHAQDGRWAVRTPLSEDAIDGPGVKPQLYRALLLTDGEPARELEAAWLAKPVVIDAWPVIATVNPTPGASAQSAPVSQTTAAGNAGSGGLLQAAKGPDGAESRDSASQTFGGDNEGSMPAVSATTLGWALVLAVISGALLNLMPCVFPVVGLKIMAFVQQRDQRPMLHAAAYTLGVLLCFWGLAGAMIVLRSAGESVGWGFQLQSPAFVAFLFALFVLVALNLSGVFEIGLSVSAAAGQADRHHGVMGSLASGALASLVATPCFAPFMGVALGYTLVASPLESFAVFSALALGMASPYLILAAVPGLLKRLPKPGAWMATFRQVLAFPMFATCFWLAWVYGKLAGLDAMTRLLMASVLLALAAWLYGRFLQLREDKRWVAVPALLAVGLAAWLGWPSEPEYPTQSAGSGTSEAMAAGAASDGAASRKPAKAWQPWSESEVAALQAQGKAVFVDFTAAWCVSCQVNKAMVLDRADVVGVFEQRGVARLQADWTHRDAAITKALASFGRNGVPLYLVYPAGGGKPKVLPELLTKAMVVEALEAATRK